jgi:1-acyl-sn-glycerol-3-phosphate acyltransferase
MTLRTAGRLGWIAVEITGAVFDYFLEVVLNAPKNLRAARALWMHRAAGRQLKIFNCLPDVSGPVPKNGLLVSNHLGYFDVLAIAAVTPAVFVSKAEVRRWPLFGWLAKLGGTIFIQRERRLHVGEVNREIETALAAGLLVVIFPEGTSSNGETVLPFRAPLLEPALRGGNEITIACLQYGLDDGDARQEVCYWGGHTFFPHLLNLLGKKSVRATVQFGKFNRTTGDRKELAKQLHAAVSDLKTKG